MPRRCGRCRWCGKLDSRHTATGKLATDLQGFARSEAISYQQRCWHILLERHRTHKMTKPILDDATLDNFSPYEATAMLEKLNEIYKDGISAREATELHRLERRLRVRAST